VRASSRQEYRIRRDDLIDAIGALELRAEACEDHALFAVNAGNRSIWKQQAKHFKAAAKRIQKAIDNE
jgi:hypothetical protein